MNSATTILREEPIVALPMALGPKELRTLLYQNFEVLESMLRGKPVYIATCRACMRMVVVVDRGNKEVEATLVWQGLEHVKTHDAIPGP
jgi:hypothetical protein